MSAQHSQELQQPEAPTPVVSLPESQTTTALALVTQSITELNKVALEVAALEPKFKGVVFDVKTTAGMKAACEARLAIRKPRYAIQKMQKDAKTPLNALKKGIDDQVEAVIARIEAIEGPVHQQITNEEARKEKERTDREDAERQRVESIQGRIENDIRQAAFAATGRDAAQIEVLIKDVVAIEINESFAEFRQQAEGAKATALIRLRAALATAQAMEAEEARLAAERAENERIRLENEEAARVQREQLAEAQRLAREELERERLRQQAAADVDRARAAEEERRAKEARDAETARQAAALRLQREENDRIERERQEAHEAEARRIATERAEAERIEAERQVAREAQERRLADERAQLERDQEELRAAQALAAAPPSKAAAPAVDEPAPESGLVAQEPVVETAAEPEALIASIDLKELLLMQSVCKFAQAWAVFQHRDSKLDQKKDRRLAAEAKAAEANLLSVIEQLPPHYGP